MGFGATCTRGFTVNVMSVTPQQSMTSHELQRYEGKCYLIGDTSFMWCRESFETMSILSNAVWVSFQTIVIIFVFLAATKQLYEWYFLSVCPSVRLSVCLSVCPSVRLSVCPSVRLSHLFDYVPIIVSSWNFQELSHWTRVRSMQKVKVRGQRSRSQRSRPNFSFPDCNSSLNSHMMMKWYI